MMNVRTSLLAIFVVGAEVVFASQTGSFERTLTVTSPVVLDVKSDAGSVKITTGESSSVRIQAIIRPLYGPLDLGVAQSSIDALQQNPPIEQTAGSIRIGYGAPDVLKSVSMSLEIEVPADTQVQVQTTSGGISVSGIHGSLTARTNSGRVEALDVTGGQVHVRTESGGIQVFGSNGGIDVKTTSGRTEISDVNGDVRSTTRSGSISIDNTRGDVTAKNVSGSIDAFRLSGAVNAQTNSGAIRISQSSAAPIRALSRSGAIKVELASRAGYLIDAQSVSGRVSGPVAENGKGIAGQHLLKQQVGAGGPLVDLDSRSSKIEID